MKHIAGQSMAQENVLIVGAGEAGRGILREYVRLKRGDLVAGFIDGDLQKADSVIDGKKVLGTRENIDGIISTLKISRLVIALPSADSDVVRETVVQVLSVT